MRASHVMCKRPPVLVRIYRTDKDVSAYVRSTVEVQSAPYKEEVLRTPYSIYVFAPHITCSFTLIYVPYLKPING